MKSRMDVRSVGLAALRRHLRDIAGDAKAVTLHAQTNWPDPERIPGTYTYRVLSPSDGLTVTHCTLDPATNEVTCDETCKANKDRPHWHVHSIRRAYFFGSIPGEHLSIAEVQALVTSMKSRPAENDTDFSEPKSRQRTGVGV